MHVSLAIPFLEIHPPRLQAGSQRDIYKSMFIATLFPRAKMVEVTQMSVSGSMNKQTVVYTHNGTLLSLQKKGNPDICYNMDKT